MKLFHTNTKRNGWRYLVLGLSLGCWLLMGAKAHASEEISPSTFFVAMKTHFAKKWHSGRYLDKAYVVAVMGGVLLGAFYSVVNELVFFLYEVVVHLRGKDHCFDKTGDDEGTRYIDTGYSRISYAVKWHTFCYFTRRVGFLQENFTDVKKAFQESGDKKYIL
ncbi:MAG: hypothetical protein ACPGC9_01340 [Cytophagales bacterium]